MPGADGEDGLNGPPGQSGSDGEKGTSVSIFVIEETSNLLSINIFCNVCMKVTTCSKVDMYYHAINLKQKPQI